MSSFYSVGKKYHVVFFRTVVAQTIWPFLSVKGSVLLPGEMHRVSTCNAAGLDCKFFHRLPSLFEARGVWKMLLLVDLPDAGISPSISRESARTGPSGCFSCQSSASCVHFHSEVDCKAEKNGSKTTITHWYLCCIMYRHGRFLHNALLSHSVSLLSDEDLELFEEDLDTKLDQVRVSNAVISDFVTSTFLLMLLFVSQNSMRSSYDESKNKLRMFVS
jgi:hypothetical protein